jgi:hypothetical protein
MFSRRRQVSLEGDKLFAPPVEAKTAKAAKSAKVLSIANPTRRPRGR